MRKTGRRLIAFVSRLTSHVLRSSNDSGMALVLVLLIVTLITAMVVEFAYGVYVNTNALYNWQTSQKLSFAAKSATKLASKLVTSNMIEQYRTKPVFEMSQKIPFGDLDGTIILRIEDENAKFNLNSLRNPIGSDNDDAYNFFSNLLKNLHLNAEIAKIVCYWINTSTSHRPENSSSMKPKNTYLDSVDELLMITGIDRETYGKLLPYVTIYGSGEGMFSININTADIPVLMSLSDAISNDMAERVVTYRQITPFIQGPDIFRVSGFNINMIKNTSYLTANGAAFHVIATAESGGIKRIVESVLESNTVKYWKEM